MNFLPTTTFSAFFWDLSHNLLAGIYPLLGCVAVLVVVIVTASLRPFDTTLLWKIFGGIAILSFAATAMGGVLCWTEGYANEVKQIESNQIHNLKQKYNFRDVDYNLDDYNLNHLNGDDENGEDFVEPSPMGSSKGIILIANDGNKIAFLLHEDPKTSEPTLSELPEGSLGRTPLSVVAR